MVVFELQPIHVYIASAIGGIFLGMGSAVGAVIVELWIKPRLKHWRKKHKEVMMKIVK